MVDTPGGPRTLLGPPRDRAVGRLFVISVLPLAVTEGSGVPTGCSQLDELLGGGLERGAVTQLYGPPASGKTNVALSSAVETATREKRALYIDTEGISVSRFEQLLSAYSDDIETTSSRIVISEAHDFAEQDQAVRDAEQLASRVELVVLDSATGFYRLQRSSEDDGETLRDVARQVTHLLSLARKHDLAILITNQVYTDPDSDGIRPLGGHTLEHWTGTVVRLERFRGGNRRATLEKHRAKATGASVQFQITDSGLVESQRS